jgi:hypothetical protein
MRAVYLAPEKILKPAQIIVVDYIRTIADPTRTNLH